VPPPNATIWAWVICQFRYVSALSSFNSNRFNAVWGGSMCMRKADLDENLYGVVTSWQNGGYADDNTVQGCAADAGMQIATPLSNIFPNHLKEAITFASTWNFVRRQTAGLRTYQTRSMCARQYFLLFVLAWLMFNTVVGSCISAFFLAFSIVYPVIFTLYPLLSILVVSFLVSYLIALAALHQLVLVAYNTCQVLSPSRNLPQLSHFHFSTFVFSYMVNAYVILFAVVVSCLSNTIEWGGIVYRFSWGLLVEVTHPDDAIEMSKIKSTEKTIAVEECKSSVLEHTKKFGALALTATAMMGMNLLFGGT